MEFDSPGAQLQIDRAYSYLDSITAAEFPSAGSCIDNLNVKIVYFLFFKLNFYVSLENVNFIHVGVCESTVQI